MAEKVEFYRETEFKDTEIGRIPKEWEVIRFGDIVNLVKGRRPKEFANERVKDSLPYLSAENLRNNNVVQFVEVSDDIILVDDSDLILIWDGSNAGEFFLGKRGVLSSTMVKILLKKKLYDSKFLFYLLKTKENYLKDQTKGTGIPHVDETILRSLVIPLPPSEEQQKIAEILSTVDEAIQKTNDIIAKTERLKKGLMQELLTKGIGHKEFKDTEIGKIPKEWEVAQLGSENVSILIKSGSTPLKKVKEYWNGNIPFVTQSDMTKVDRYLHETSEKITDLGLKNSNLLLIPEDSVLLSMYGTIGKVVINKTPVAISQNIAAIILNKKNVNHEYLFYAVQKYSFQLNRRAKIITLKHLDIQIIKNMLLPFPSLQEQQKIAEILSTVDKKLEILKQEKVKLERIKQWFMEELLTGRIRVRVA